MSFDAKLYPKATRGAYTISFLDEKVLPIGGSGPYTAEPNTEFKVRSLSETKDFLSKTYTHLLSTQKKLGGESLCYPMSGLLAN